MQRAIDRMRDLWANGEHRRALKLAASWPRLGPHKGRIQQGWAAASNQNFYRQIGKDPDALYADGLAALAERYDLTPNKETRP